jgi:hypothetical protein
MSHSEIKLLEKNKRLYNAYIIVQISCCKVKCKHMDVIWVTKGSEVAFWMSRKNMAAVLKGTVRHVVIF